MSYKQTRRILKLVTDKFQRKGEPIESLNILYLCHFSFWKCGPDTPSDVRLESYINLVRSLGILELEMTREYGTQTLLTLALHYRISTEKRASRLKLLLDNNVSEKILLDSHERFPNVFELAFLDKGFSIFKELLSDPVENKEARRRKYDEGCEIDKSDFKFCFEIFFQVCRAS